jgi:hypothetical protein
LTTKDEIAALKAKVAEQGEHIRFLMAQFSRMAKHTELPPAVIAVTDPLTAQINSSMRDVQAAGLQALAGSGFGTRAITSNLDSGCRLLFAQWSEARANLL